MGTSTEWEEANDEGEEMSVGCPASGRPTIAGRRSEVTLGPVTRPP